MKMNLRHAIIAVVLMCFFGVSVHAQKAWIAGRSDYSSLFASIKGRNAIKIMQIGDSHINGGYTSEPIRSALSSKYANVTFTFYGINGATYNTWLQEQNVDKIKQEAPDLLIISLGTNDSYTRNFSSEKLRAAIQEFTSKVKALLPNTRIILTTPPANYLRDARSQVVGYTKSKRKKRRRPIYKTTTVYAFNQNARVASNTIKYFGQASAMPVIDLHAFIGTKLQAEDWLKKGWMASDHVHFSELGYTKQGEIMATALLSAIDESK